MFLIHENFISLWLFNIQNLIFKQLLSINSYENKNL